MKTHTTAKPTELIAPPAPMIRQRELRAYKHLADKVAMLETQRQEAEKNLMQLLGLQVPVQKGKLTAQLSTMWRANVAWRKEFEKFGDEVLGEGLGFVKAEAIKNDTPKTPSTRLVVQ